MTYTAAAVVGVLAAVVLDLAVLRTRLLRSRDFWTAYAIVVGFQLVVNGVLTGTGVVAYADDAVLGVGSSVGERPPFLGSGRLAFAPVEDLLFGFALVLVTLACWDRLAPFRVLPSSVAAEDVRALLAAHREWASLHSPPEDVHAVSPEEASDLVLFAARDRSGRLLGTGALREVSPGHVEIKSMRTVEAARGRGVARAVLLRLLAEARSRGYRRVSLETGSMEAFAPARALYASAGFVECPPFGDYRDSPRSTCMTREL